MDLQLTKIIVACLIGVLVTLNIKSVKCQGYLTVVPEDTAVVSGSTATLYCTANTTQNLISWSFVIDRTSIPLVGGNCVLSSAYSQQYSVTNSPLGVCNLNVLTNTSAAGTYTCSLFTGSLFTSVYADLTVFDTYPVIWTNATNGTVAFNGEYILILCHVNFTGVNVPWMSWTSPGGIEMTNYTTFNLTKRVESFIEVPAYPNSYWSGYVCNTGYSSTYPTFNYNISVSNISVYYCPSSILISPSGGQVGQGQVFFCTATGGYPPPSFLWIDLQTGSTVTGPSTALWTLGSYSYMCIATIPLAGCNMTAIANGTVVAQAPGTQGTTNTTAIIIGAVCGAVAVILIVILIIALYIKCFKNKRKNKKETDNNSNIDGDSMADMNFERNQSSTRVLSTGRTASNSDWIRAPSTINPDRIRDPPTTTFTPPPPHSYSRSTGVLYRYPTNNRQSGNASLSFDDINLYSGHHSPYGEIEI